VDTKNKRGCAVLHYWKKRAYLKKRAGEIIQCWWDLRRVRGITDIPALVDFAFAHCIRPDQVRTELIELMRVVANLRPATALEIGTHSGGTLFLLCKLSAVKAKIISVDLPRGRFGGGYTAGKVPLYRRFARDGQSLHFLRQDSHKQETADAIKNILGGAPLGYLFIDGDHTYEGVKQDFEMYSPLVGEGGVVAIHDIAGAGSGWGSGVQRFWKEVRGGRAYQEIIANATQEGCGIGLLWM
jgi:predicted O-methyltransferase YrrM